MANDDNGWLDGKLIRRGPWINVVELWLNLHTIIKALSKHSFCENDESRYLIKRNYKFLDHDLSLEILLAEIRIESLFWFDA